MNLNNSRLVFPAFAQGTDKRGDVNLLMDPEWRKFLGLQPGIGGGAKGYNTEGDLITQTIDGVNLNTVWRDFQASIAIRNRERQTLIDFLSYSVSQPVVTVPQFGAGDEFEEASEFGVPVGIRTEASYFQMGFPFKWYDTGIRYTWKFLADATAEQIESNHQSVLDADSRLLFKEVMRTLFRPTNRTAEIRGQAFNVYAFYNADATVPPEYKSVTHAGTHTHYLVSGAATIDSGDVDEVQNHLTHHGYSRENGVELILMVNVQEGDVIRQFRSIANGGTAKFDFIPSTSQPSFLLPVDLRVDPSTATRPPGQLKGLNVIGAYGQFLIVQEEYVPAGYMVAFGTGGSENLTNPIGIREHANPALRGMRLVKGRRDDYPLQDSYYQRGFGAGIRQRGAGVIMQVKATGSYAAPPAYV